MNALAVKISEWVAAIDETTRELDAAAAARGLTIGEYLAKVVALHEAMRTKADGGSRVIADALEALGLETVRT